MSSVNIGVLISGGGTNLQALIDNVANNIIKGNIKLVISNKSDVYGLRRAIDNNIEAFFLDRTKFKSDEEYNEKLIEEFKALDIELVILAGYLKKLSNRFIDEYRMRIINIHPSLIPSFSGKGYYGDNVHRAVLDRGVKITGATVHFVDEGTDTGPIILQKCLDIDGVDDIEVLKERVLKIEHSILVEAVSLYCDRMLEVKNGKVNIRKVQR